MINHQEQEIIDEQANSNGRATPIWRDAFGSNFSQKWGNLSSKGLNGNADQMSYYKALACFLQGGKDAVMDRVALMYSMLKASGFQVKYSSDGIRKHYASLPSSNTFVKKVLSNLCTIFLQNPDVKLLLQKEPVTDDKLLSMFNDITQDAAVNYKLLNAHRRAKFIGEVALHPRIRRGQLQLQMLTPDKYQAVYDSYGNMLEIYIPFYETINKPGTDVMDTVLRYEYWNNKIYQVLDENGDYVSFTHTIQKYNPDTLDFTTTQQLELTELQHGYGRIPYEILSFDINDNDNTGGSDDLYELLKAQLVCNCLDYMAMENVTYSAIAMWVITNFNQGRNITIAPGAAFVMDGVKEPAEGELTTPTIDSVSQTTYFDAINELKRQFQLQTMKDLGLPNSLVLDNPGLASGEAMKVDYRELENIRKEDIELLKPFHKRLLSLVLTVASKDTASPYYGKIQTNYDYSIDYKELINQEKTKEEIETLIQKKDLFVLSPLELLSALNKNDNITTDEDAIELMLKNKEFYKLLGVTNEQNGQPGADTQTGGDDEQGDSRRSSTEERSDINSENPENGGTTGSSNGDTNTNDGIGKTGK